MADQEVVKFLRERIQLIRHPSDSQACDRVIEVTIGHGGLPGKEIRARSACGRQKVPIVTRRRRDRGFRFIKTYSSRCRRPHIGSQRPSCLRRRRAIVRSAAGSPEGYLPRYCDLGHLKVTWRPRLTTL